jgi:cytochrome c-type biogenesis protein CcmH
MTHDPLRHLSQLRGLREQLQQLPTESPQRAEVTAALVAAVMATRPAEHPPLPWRQRLALASFVLCAGLAGYAATGSLQGWQARPPVDAGEAMVQRLAGRLAADPGAASAADWAMLGRSQAVLGRDAEAAEAYRRALALQPDADTLTALADLLATGRGGALQGEPAQLIAQALALAPEHPRALALAAAAAWQAGRRDEAARLWTRLRALLPADDPLRAAAERGLAMHQSGKP